MLVKITNQEDNDNVKSLVPQLTWIGLHDMDKNDIYTWADGTPVSTF